MGKDAGSPPQTDYMAQANASHVNQITPYGSQIYTPAGQATAATPASQGHWTGGTNTYSGGDTRGTGTQGQTWVPGSPGTPGTPGSQATSTITLDPRVQHTLDSQLKLSGQMGDLAVGQADQVANQGPFDLSSVQAINDKAYGALTSRLDPQWQQREDQERTRLANQGVSYGSEAYSNDMRDFNTGRNDAYQHANLAAIQTMPQTYQLASEAYNQPLNRLNALRSGAQVNTPQFGNMDSGSLQAAQLQNQNDLAGYNANVASNNAMTSGLFGLGGAGLAGYLAFLSDRRLKRDIVKIGDDSRGFGIYSYTLFNQPEIGVMADEVEKVLPDAVVTLPSGYKAVYYGRL